MYISVVTSVLAVPFTMLILGKSWNIPMKRVQIYAY